MTCPDGSRPNNFVALAPHKLSPLDFEPSEGGPIYSGASLDHCQAINHSFTIKMTTAMRSWAEWIVGGILEAVGLGLPVMPEY